MSGRKSTTGRSSGAGAEEAAAEDRHMRVDDAVDVRRIRQKLNLSQAEFAERFGFSVSAVRHWEQGSREPEAAARTLLRLIDKDPGFVMGAPMDKFRPDQPAAAVDICADEDVLLRAISTNIDDPHVDELREQGATDDDLRWFGYPNADAMFRAFARHADHVAANDPTSKASERDAVAARFAVTLLQATHRALTDGADETIRLQVDALVACAYRCGAMSAGTALGANHPYSPMERVPAIRRKKGGDGKKDHDAKVLAKQQAVIKDCAKAHPGLSVSELAALADVRRADGKPLSQDRKERLIWKMEKDGWKGRQVQA